MMKGARARRTATWGVIVLALLVATVTLVTTRDATILDRAVRLTSTTQWRPLGPYENPFYFWTSSREVQFFQNVEAHLASYKQQVYPANSDARPVAVPGADLPAGATPVNLSPDGKWLAWSRPARQNWHFGVTSLAGQPVPAWPKRWMGFPFWSADSSHLYTVVSHWSQHRWSLERYTANQARPETIPLPKGSYLNTYMGFLGYGADQSSLVFTTTPVFTVSANNRQFASGNYHIVEIDPVTWRVLHEWKGQAPAQYEVASYSMSPRGDRLLWHCITWRANSIEEFFHRFVPVFPIHRMNQHSWYTTQLDGSGREAVGTYIQELTQTASPEMQFTPDGARLSFIYRGSLYVLPARR